MPLIGTLGGTLPSGLKSLKVKCQAFPHDGSTGLKQPTPASPPVTDNHQQGWSQGCKWMWQADPRISWLTRGLPTLSWPPAPQPSPLRPVPFWVLLEKQLQRFTWALLCCWMDNYFPISLWWSLSVLLPYWEEIFPCLQNLAAIAVLIEDTLKLSFGGKLTIFISNQVKQLLMGETIMDVWSKAPQTSSRADGNSRPDYIPLWGS